MTRGAEQRIADILEAIDRCVRYAGTLDSPDADLIHMAEDAIERNLQIIGEAANHLPEEVTDEHPDIAWPQIRGLRNILVHQYFGVDRGVIRDVVDAHLAPLARALQSHAGG
jgi:uncharacterized protein with HEPN domain